MPARAVRCLGLPPRTRLRHLSLTVPDAPKAMLDEIWQVRVLQSPRPLRVRPGIDSKASAGKSPMVVERVSLCRHGDRGARAVGIQPGAIRFSHQRGGSTVKTATKAGRGWVDFYGPIGGRTIGILVLDHPTNFAFRSRCGCTRRCLISVFAPASLGSFTIAPGRLYVSRYRFVVHDGPLPLQTAEQLWHDYA